jgi:hypothetical protein
MTEGKRKYIRMNEIEKRTKNKENRKGGKVFKNGGRKVGKAITESTVTASGGEAIEF